MTDRCATTLTRPASSNSPLLQKPANPAVANTIEPQAPREGYKALQAQIVSRLELQQQLSGRAWPVTTTTSLAAPHSASGGIRLRRVPDATAGS